MRALSAAELFDVWERGQGRSPAQRALLLLAVASQEIPLESLAQSSIGRRDADLLALREHTFGSQLASTAVCPSCSVQLEFRIDADDICRAAPVASPTAAELIEGEWKVAFRLPNSLDLGTLDPTGELATNRQRLFERCVTEAKRAGQPIGASLLPEAVVAAVSRRMNELDPQADTQIALACPECHHQWQTPLDPISYFWSEIQEWGHRILRDVHALASAYGWREVDVLALSAWRRQAYLELIGA